MRGYMRWWSAIVVFGLLGPWVGGAGRAAGLDPTFGSPATPGVLKFDRYPESIYHRDGLAAWPDGSFVVGVGSELHKFSASGAADSSFGNAGVFSLPCALGSNLALDGSGRIIVGLTNACTGVGNQPVRLVMRLSSAGVEDTAFDGTVGAPAIFGATTVLSTTGGVVIASSGNGQGCLYRFGESDGVADNAFGVAGAACVSVSPADEAHGAARPDGGFWLAVSDGQSTRVVGFGASGVLQNQFTVSDAGIPTSVDAAATPSNGLLLVGTTWQQQHSWAWVRRFDASGQLDSTFNPGAAQPGVVRLDDVGGRWTITPIADGRLVVTGGAGNQATALLLTSDGRTDAGLEATSRTPGRIALEPPVGSVNDRSTFTSAVVSNGRLLAIGAEWDATAQFVPTDTTTVVVRSDVIGSSDPADTALFRSTPPRRVLDTRPGPLQRGYVGPKPAPGATFDVQIAGQVGLPGDDIAAVALNLTATETTAAGYVSVWPAGALRPVVSSLNIEHVGQTLPNMVIVPVGDNGKISLFTLGGGHFIADVLGWFPKRGGIQTLVPTRVLDSRPGPGQTGYSGAKPASGQTVKLQVAGRAGLPAAGVSAAIVNLTLTEADAAGYVTAWASGAPQTMTSNLNASAAGQSIQNLAIVPVGSDGAINLYTMAGAHLIADLVAWLPSGSGYRAFPSLNPRILDTRIVGTPPMYGHLAAGQTIHVLSSVPGVKMLNVTATGVDAPGYITVWPSGTDLPVASNLNPEYAGQTIANAVVVSTDPSGSFDLFTQSGGHVVVDLFGVFPFAVG